MIFYIVLIAGLTFSVAISETRLSENSVSNIELPHYYFFHHDSPTVMSQKTENQSQGLIFN